MPQEQPAAGGFGQVTTNGEYIPANAAAFGAAGAAPQTPHPNDLESNEPQA